MNTTTIQSSIATLAAVLALAGCANDENPNRVVGQLASDRYELTAEVGEPITAINVAEGEIVTAGQVLLTQDDTRARAQLAESNAALAQQQARVDELVRGPRSEQIAAARANVEGATQELEFRQADMKRIEEIHARGLTSPDVLDRASAALDAAQAGLKLRLAQLEEKLAGTTIEELAQAEQSVEQQAARRDAVQVDLDRHATRAPVDGIADTRLFEIGERPVPGQPDDDHAWWPTSLRTCLCSRDHSGPRQQPEPPRRSHVDGLGQTARRSRQVGFQRVGVHSLLRADRA